MISCDTNVLFVALEASRPGHRSARTFLELHAKNPSFALCELVLMELYVLLRNPATTRRPLDSVQAAQIVGQLRSNPVWHLLDYPGPDARIMPELWSIAGTTGFARRRIFDARIALTLRHHGVSELATANGKDFDGFGFKRVWNPIDTHPG
jgi:toxin-antitoxin system PIN domain toxin